MDCISYEPTALTTVYAAGVWAVKQNQNEIVRVYGGPSENAGQKLLALAKRYRQVCFIGRANYRDEKEAYIFEYWRNPSAINSPIPDSEDDCSSYDRNNLQVNDMGSGHGWRVKDDDHVLQMFDNEADAKNGKIVLAKYNQICDVDSETPDGTAAAHHLRLTSRAWRGTLLTPRWQGAPPDACREDRHRKRPHGADRRPGRRRNARYC